MSKYKFETNKEDYSLYGSGNVFTSAPGATGFPVRLASEVFQLCLALRPSPNHAERVVLYDPCCGAGYLLATIAYRHWANLKRVIGSDFDEEILLVAERNLSLLTRAGLNVRMEFLRSAQERERRPSRDVAIRSIESCLDRLSTLEQMHSVGYSLFRADAGSPQDVAAGMTGSKADIVIADIPYSGLSNWKGQLATRQSRKEAVSLLMQSLQPVLAPNAIVAIISPKGDDISHPSFYRHRKLKLGKRSVTFMSEAPLKNHQ